MSRPHAAAHDLPRAGRVAGALYLVVVLSGMFCLAYVPAQLAASTGVSAFAAAADRTDLFRAGVAAFLAMQVAFLLLPLALYRVFADAAPRAAVLMVALAAVAVPIGLVGALHQLDALALLQGGVVPAGRGVETAFAESRQHYRQALRVASLFWGLWLLPFGYAVLRTGRLPRVLGALLVLGGVGYVVQVFGGLWPAFAASPLAGHITRPAALGEIGSCLWLLAFGARTPAPASGRA